MPFLDHHVVEVIRSQPVNQKIRGMTEKFVLREAVRDVITDTVYRRQKHPFLSPPATLNPEQGLNALVQDTLRGTALRLDAVLRSEEGGRAARRAFRTMDEGTRVAGDQMLMMLTSAASYRSDFGWRPRFPGLFCVCWATVGRKTGESCSIVWRRPVLSTLSVV